MGRAGIEGADIRGKGEKKKCPYHASKWESEDTTVDWVKRNLRGDLRQGYLSHLPNSEPAGWEREESPESQEITDEGQPHPEGGPGRRCRLPDRG